MDYISEAICEVFKERYSAPAHACWLEEKLKELKKNKTKLDGMMYLYKVDKVNTPLVAEKLNVTVEDIEQLKAVLAKF